jgi:anti-sigma factor RsiW
MSTEEDDIKLLEYLDGKLSGDDAAQLLQRLENDAALKARLRELQGLNAMFSGYSAEQPSAGFTQRVMSRLNQYPRGAVAPIRRGLMLLAGLLATVVIASWLLSIGIFDNTRINLNTVVFTSERVRDALPTLTFDGKTLVNVIIVFNLVVAFFLLDRMVLKPWFQRRSRFNY